MTLAAILIAAFLLHCTRAAAEGATDFHVAPTGDDRNPGNKLKPFATLERARDAIRVLKKAGGLPKGGVTVWVRGGIYTIASTLELTADDSGAKDAPIVYRVFEGEDARLVGGKEIAFFEPVRDPKILRRLDEGCRDKILQADLKARGITDFGRITARGFRWDPHPAGLELFFQDKPMTLARWPNGDWAEIAEVPAGKNGGKFTYEGDRPKRWTEVNDVWVHGYWRYDWADSYNKVESIDTETREIVIQEPQSIYGYRASQRYYALNILEELDEAGEWYLDRKTGILYFWPPSPLNKGKTFVSLLEEPVVALRDVSYVTLRSFIIECSRGNGVEITGGFHNTIAGCTIRNIGNAAICVSGGRENGVVACDLYEIGDGGIILDGGDRLTLTPAGNYAKNNHIHDFGRLVRTYQPAIAISGVGNRVSHNLIHNSPHIGIWLHGNEHIIEFNDIHHVCLETTDVGAFYMGRDLTERGNIVRHNYFHELPKGGRHSIYLDDFAGGTTVYGNVFYDTDEAIYINSGRGNIIKNNIFVSCAPAVFIWDSRGAKFWFDGTDTTLTDRLEAVNYKQPPYILRYPILGTIMDDEPAAPKFNKIVRNVCFRGYWLKTTKNLDVTILEIKDNLTEGDPGFVDPAGKNFQLKDDSPAYKFGFKRIPMEKIGLYKDKYRKRPSAVD